MFLFFVVFAVFEELLGVVFLFFVVSFAVSVRQSFFFLNTTSLLVKNHVALDRRIYMFPTFSLLFLTSIKQKRS